MIQLCHSSKVDHDVRTQEALCLYETKTNQLPAAQLTRVWTHSNHFNLPRLELILHLSKVTHFLIVTRKLGGMFLISYLCISHSLW